MSSPRSGSRTFRLSISSEAVEIQSETEPLLSGFRAEYGSLPDAEGKGEKADGANNVHCHAEYMDNHGIDKKARRKLIIASIVCLLFMTGEIVGGALAGSLAIATDAAHLLTDFASFMISLFAIYLASRPATKSMSFGWYRAEVMGALISVLLIWVVTGILVYMAAERVVRGEFEINATVMLITAGLGVGVNIIMGCTLHDHGHSHGGSSHGHSHDKGKNHGHSHSEDDGHGHSHSKPEATEKTKLTGSDKSDSPSDVVLDLSDTGNSRAAKAKSKENLNVRAAFIHVVGDFVQSVGVFIAALIIYFKPEWKIADPICTFLFSVLVLITTITILKDTLLVLMEATPRGISFTEVRETLCGIKGVKELHNLRIWSLTTAKAALAVHLALDGTVDAQEVLLEAGQVMRDEFGITECTIQLENYTIDMDDCTHCQGPKD